MSCLYRWDELKMPTTLNVSTNTAVWEPGSLTGSPKMLPMKHVLSKVAKGPSPGAPIAMQLLTLTPKPVPASSPTATLPLPSTKLRSASSPMAVLLAPDVVFHGKITERIIFTGVIGEERAPPVGVVECTTYIG